MPTTIDSTRFGSLEIPDDAVIEFPTGLIGLGGTRYTLIAREESAPFLWLHSIDDPSLALPVTQPVAVLRLLRGGDLGLRGRSESA